MSLATNWRIAKAMPFNPTAEEYANVTARVTRKIGGSWLLNDGEGAITVEDAVLAYDARDAARRTEGYATATLVLGILGFFPFSPTAIVAFITAHFATRGSSRTAGLVCAWITVGISVLFVLYLVAVAGILSSAQ